MALVFQPGEQSLGFVEFVPSNDVKSIECNIEGRLLALQLDNPCQPGGQAQGRARIDLKATGNRLQINIEFPSCSRLTLPVVPVQPRVAAAVPPVPRATGGAPIHQTEEDSTLSSTPDSSPAESSSEASTVERTPRRSGNKTAATADLSNSPVPLSHAPQFERAQREPIEPVQSASLQSSVGPAAAPPQPFGAVVQDLTQDHEAMAMHRVSEDDARIKARRQEARLDAAAAKFSSPSATGHGIDFAQRKSIDAGRRASIQQQRDAGAPAAGAPEEEAGRQSEQLDDVEYTKDEELERVKGFWRKIFHRKKKTGSTKNVAAAKA